MSGQCTGWVLAHGPHPDDIDRDGKPYGQRARGFRAVLLTIADAANAQGQHAHPGLQAMCRGSLYSRRQVQNIEDDLVAEGWVVVTAKGGGRMKATVYDVNMDWREKVQPLRPTPIGKGAPPPPERVQPAPETVQPGVHPNGVATNTVNEPPAAVGSDEHPGHDIVRAFYDWCEANGRPKPTLPQGRHGNQFVALVKIVDGLLAAGWPEAAVKRALTTTRAYTTDALTFSLNDDRAARGAVARPIDADRGAGSGEVGQDELWRDR